jgi:hypothetical protein
MKFSEILSQVIDLAKKANVARAQRAVASGGFPAVTSGVQAQGIQVQGQPGLIAVPPGPPEERALFNFLESQSPETIYMLTALMYLGRGDFDARSLLDNFALMGERFGDPRWAAGQMADKIALPQYLEGGLRKAKQANIDLDATISMGTA